MVDCLVISARVLTGKLKGILRPVGGVSGRSKGFSTVSSFGAPLHFCASWFSRVSGISSVSLADLIIIPVNGTFLIGTSIREKRDFSRTITLVRV